MSQLHVMLSLVDPLTEVWRQGEVHLRNVDLKPSAFDSFDLPITVRKGLIGSIDITLPWTALSTSPVHVELQNVHILVGPNFCASAEDQSEWEARKEAEKLATLKHGLERQRAALLGYQHDTSTAGLVECMLKNLRLNIVDLHVRYVNMETATPFILGMHLASASITSTNQLREAVEIPSEADSEVDYKQISLGALEVYWAQPGSCMEKVESVQDAEEMNKTNVLEVWRLGFKPRPT